MAPQNLNQVFVANSGTLLDDAEAFNTAAVATSSKVGVWNLGIATPAYIDITTPADMMSLQGPIQIVQTMPSGSLPIASPIIDIKDIKRIKHTPAAASVRHSAAINVGNPTTGDNVMVRIALRTAPTAYANYYQDGTAVDLSASNTQFPLIGNFSAGRMIFNIEVTGAEHAATEATLYDKIIEKLQANHTLSDLFTTTDNGTDMVIAARHAGVVFDVTIAYSSGTNTGTALTAPTMTGFDAGAGNYWQVLSDEKSCRSKYGNFNRMYFPYNFPTFAQSGTSYDVVEIQYAHAHPAGTGIARAGELNTIKIYIVDTAAGSTTADTVFLGASAANWGATATERLF
jgi:hypothetical protein